MQSTRHTNPSFSTGNFFQRSSLRSSACVDMDADAGYWLPVRPGRIASYAPWKRIFAPAIRRQRAIRPAIRPWRNSSETGDVNRRDLDGRVLLRVTGVADVALAALEFADFQLAVIRDVDDLSGD